MCIELCVKLYVRPNIDQKLKYPFLLKFQVQQVGIVADALPFRFLLWLPTKLDGRLAKQTEPELALKIILNRQNRENGPHYALEAELEVYNSIGGEIQRGDLLFQTITAVQVRKWLCSALYRPCRLLLLIIRLSGIILIKLIRIVWYNAISDFPRKMNFVYF